MLIRVADCLLFLRAIYGFNNKMIIIHKQIYFQAIVVSNNNLHTVILF